MSIEVLRPTFHADSVERLTPDALKDVYEQAPHHPKIEVVAFDVDGTLMEHHAGEIGEDVRNTLETLSEAGKKLFIVSNAYNTMKKNRVDELHDIVAASRLPIDVYTPARVANGESPKKYRKPNPAMLEAIAQSEAVHPRHILMVGDQAFKDVLSAHRAGAQSLLVPRMGEGDDWKVKSFQRPVEKLVRQALSLPIHDADFPKGLAFGDAPQAPDGDGYLVRVP